MAATLNFFQYISAWINNQLKRFGSLELPYSYGSLTGLIHDQVLQVAPVTQVVLFDSTQDLGDFDLLCVETDLDVMIEIVIDQNNTFGTRHMQIKLPGSGVAGKYGPPLTIPSNIAYANSTIAFAAGTLDVIDKINSKNLSATLTANVHVFAVT
jgi:hypothetical protein